MDLLWGKGEGGKREIDRDNDQMQLLPPAKIKHLGRKEIKITSKSSVQILARLATLDK